MSQPGPTGIGKGRLEALADGVFAVAMTLLVLDLKVPPAGAADAPADLPRRLAALWPRVLAYVVSFLVLGVYWVGHHALMHYVRRADRPFLWLNLVWLLVITAVPFSASLLSEYHDQPAAVVVYCGNLTAAGLLLYGVLRYAAGPGGLVEANLAGDLIRLAGRRILMGPAIYLAALALAFVSTTASLVLCVLTPVLYILPGRVDRDWWKGGSK
jgi:uncharacterized membrane protein